MAESNNNINNINNPNNINNINNLNNNAQQYQYNPYGYVMQQPQIMYIPMQMHQQSMMMQQPMMMQQHQQPMMMQQHQQPMMMQQHQQPMMMQQPMLMQMQQQQPMIMQMQQQQPMMVPMLNPMLNPIQQSLINKVNNNKVVNNIDIDIDNVNSDKNANNDKNDKNEIDRLKQIENNIELSKKRKYQNLELNIEQKNQKDDNLLANLFDNVLDNNRINKKFKKDNSFGIDKNNSNVIKLIIPTNLNSANFNNETHPEELYNVTLFNDTNNILSSKDISKDALKTHKLTFEHNNNITRKLNNNNIQNIQNIQNINERTAVIYTRCSKVNDISIETQKDACSRYAYDSNMKLLPFGYLEDNGISGRHGKNLISGELAFWMKHIPNNSIIIVYSPDRFSRNTLKALEILEYLNSRDIIVYFVTSSITYSKDITSAQKAMVQNELMTAEKQSNDTSEKIKGTFKRLKDEGHVIGKAPYGLTNVLIDGIRKRINNNSENINIQKIKEKYCDIIENFDNYKNECVRSSNSSIIKYIIRWCNRSGIKNRNNLSFTQSTIKKIIN